MDCMPPGSSAHGIFQARTLEWVIASSSGRSSQPRDRTQVSLILYHLSHQENLSGEWSNWISFSEWCLLHFLSQLSLLNWIPHVFLPWFVKFSTSACPLPPKGLSAFLLIYPSYNRKCYLKKKKKTKHQILLKNFNCVSLPPGPRFQELPWRTPMFLLTLISQPFWTFRTWHYTFPPDSRLYLCCSFCLGSSSSYPFSHQLPIISPSCLIPLV